MKAITLIHTKRHYFLIWSPDKSMRHWYCDWGIKTCVFHFAGFVGAFPKPWAKLPEAQA